MTAVHARPFKYGRLPLGRGVDQVSVAHGILGRRQTGHFGWACPARRRSQSTQAACGRGQPWKASEERERFAPGRPLGRGSGSEKSSRHTEHCIDSPLRLTKGGIAFQAGSWGPQEL